MIDCKAIFDSISKFSLISSCDVIKNGMLRLATPFQYPDGSKIDVFLEEPQQLSLNSFPKFVLTDLGQTTANLLDLHIKPWTTKKRKQIVVDVCRALDVRQVGGELKTEVDDISKLQEAVVRLSQACLRVSDLMFTQRLGTQTAFRDDVEEFLAGNDINYDTDQPIPGQFGKDVVVDFKVIGKRVESLILTLATANMAAAHPMANEVFRKWYDLSKLRTKYQFISVYNSETNVVRDDDIARLSELSSVWAFPGQQRELLSTIAA